MGQEAILKPKIRAALKEVLKINEGLNIGSVRSPLTPVTEEDRPVVEAAAALIRETKERFL
ncbi:N-acetylneuraminate lyase [Streptococcus pneumoniae]|nr:N-acetylneuraminate lyase [Streptococcus pneumoniae]